jgi:hypothetical protein
MDTICPKCGRPAEITWSGRIARGESGGSDHRLAVRCVDLHWSVVEEAEPATLPWGTVRDESTDVVYDLTR